MDIIETWLSENHTIISIIKYFFTVAGVILFVKIFRKFLKKSIESTTLRYKTQKGIEIIGYAVIIIVSISYFTGNIKDYAVAIGFFSAGVAITLQELFLRVAGSLYIFFVNVYKPGDRIEINGIKGDVIDIYRIYAAMILIGQWVESDNYSGRILKLRISD